MTFQPKPKVESVWTIVDGLSMHARVIDDRSLKDFPTVVLVHGLGVSSRYMMPTANLLSAHARVFVPDLPGFGLSGKPRHTLSIPALADALAAWMNEANLKHATLIGNSLGAQIIVDFAVRYPLFVERAVLIAPTIDPQARGWLRQMARLLLDIPREPPGLWLIAAGDYLRAGIWRAARTLHYALADRVEDKLPLMKTPSLVIRGERDPLVPQAWAEEATRLLPNARLVVVLRAAHAVNYNAPAALVREVLLFLAEEHGPV